MKEAEHTLFDDLVIQIEDVRRLDIFPSVLLESGKPVAYAIVGHTSQEM